MGRTTEIFGEFEDVFADIEYEDDHPKPKRVSSKGTLTGRISMTATTPLKANQVRSYVNKKKETQYYLVVNKEIDASKAPKWGALWFRMQDDAPMHLSFGFKVSDEHPIVMENLNIIRDTLEKLSHGDE